MRPFLFALATAFLAAQPGSEALPLPGIPFAPRGYVCQRAVKPPVIDGRLDDAVWREAPWTEDFTDIEGPGKPAPRFRTRAKMAWDDRYFYVAAELEEPDVWATLKARDSVIFNDNDFEIFLDPDGSTSPYLEFEMNALGTVWDLLLLRPYREGGRVAVNGWDIHGLRTGVAVQGTLNRSGDKDRGWTLEVALPWTALTEIASRSGAPLPGDRWRVNFSRVEWRTKGVAGRYAKVNGPDGKPLPEDNWVWSPQGIIAMHYPEMWGFMQFSDRAAGTPEAAFALRAEDQVRWALRRVYYAQRNRRARAGGYGASLSELALDDLRLPQGWTLRLEGTEGAWIAEAQDGRQCLRIDAQGALTSRAR